MNYIIISDLARYYVVVVAVLLMVLIAQQTVYRIFDRGWRNTDSPQPTTIAALLILLTISILRRFQQQGEPGDYVLWCLVAAVTLLLIGTLTTYRIRFAPPWRR